MKDRSPLLTLLAAGLVVCALLLWLLPTDWLAGWNVGNRARISLPEAPARMPQAPAAAREEPAKAGLGDSWLAVADKVLAALKDRLTGKDARANEAVVEFKSEKAYRDFLARAEAAGLRVLDKLDGLQMVRVGFDSLDALAKDLLEHVGDYGNVGANYSVHVPGVPSAEERADQVEVGFGDQMLAFLGVSGDTSQWGRGVTIAVLDSGVAADPTFGTGRLRYLDIGLGLVGTAEGDGHGTAVASLAAGASPDAPGLAPAANLLSIKVTGADGLSDIFTLSKAIMLAVDNGAQIVNISLGAYQTSSVLSKAIEYAQNGGVVIVASAGNDQAAQLAYPAADPRVFSVGAVDALEQQVTFSNSGENLSISAPGLGLTTAWLNNQRIVFDGTSGSSPIVAGGIAAIMTAYPGMTAVQASQVLSTYSSDAGNPGADSAFGSGILNMGWAMSYGDTSRFDTAVASQTYHADSGRMEVNIQNRGGQPVSGMEVNVTSGGLNSTYELPVIGAGGSYSFFSPVDQTILGQTGEVNFRSNLVNAQGAADAVQWNNRKSSTIFKAK